MTTFEKQRSKLRAWLVVIVAALAIPSAILLWRSFTQLQYESFYSQRTIAHGRRQSASQAFLRPALKCKSLSVLTNAHVFKLAHLPEKALHPVIESLVH